MITNEQGDIRRGILYRFIKAMPLSRCTLKNNDLINQLNYTSATTLKRDISKLERLGVVSRSYSHRTKGEFWRTIIAI